jgi:hypothetical protein
VTGRVWCDFERCRCSFSRTKERNIRSNIWMVNYRRAADVGRHRLEQLQPLGAHMRLEAMEAGDVSLWVR